MTDEQLDTRIEVEIDLPDLSALFDHIDDYFEKFKLTFAEQDEVTRQVHLNGTQAGVKRAMKFWINKDPVKATFRALLQILLSLRKGVIAMHVCQYLYETGK